MMIFDKAYFSAFSEVYIYNYNLPRRALLLRTEMSILRTDKISGHSKSYCDQTSSHTKYHKVPNESYGYYLSNDTP